MKKILLLGCVIFSTSVLADKKQIEIEKTETTENLAIETVALEEKKVEKIEDVVFDLNFDKNLLSKEEQTCYIPFSSWQKSVNLYNTCDIDINASKTTVSLNLLSLQYRIRVMHEDNKHIFYDRIKMNFKVDCSIPVNNGNFSNWSYMNREEENLKKKSLGNVNWILTASAEKLGNELCEQKMPAVYKKTIEEHKAKQEKWKAMREKKELEEKKKQEKKSKTAKRIKKVSS